MVQTGTLYRIIGLKMSEINYYSMGLADASGVSGNFEAPSGSMYYNNSTKQLYISVDDDWQRIGTNPRIAKNTSSIGMVATSTYQILPMLNSVIAMPGIVNISNGLRVNKPGKYKLTAAINSIDTTIKVQTSNGQETFESQGGYIHDVLVLSANETVRVMIKRVGNKNTFVNAGNVMLILESK